MELESVRAVVAVLGDEAGVCEVDRLRAVKESLESKRALDRRRGLVRQRAVVRLPDGGSVGGFALERGLERRELALGRA